MPRKMSKRNSRLTHFKKKSPERVEEKKRSCANADINDENRSLSSMLNDCILDSPAKRGRGRPKSKRTSTTDDFRLENLINIPTGSTIQTRSRSSTPDSAIMETSKRSLLTMLNGIVDSPAKRSRGRPRSRRTSETEVATVKPVAVCSRSPTPEKKSRGRPKKLQFTSFPSTTGIVRGSYNQAHPRFGQSAGNQCTANATMALVFQNFITATTWTTETVNTVLDYGDQLYRRSIQTRIQPREAPHINTNYLEIGELCTTFMIDNRIGVNLVINQGGSADGLLGASALSLNDALIGFLAQNSSGVVICCNKSIAVFRYDRDLYYVFDSHGCDEYGMSTADGLACLTRYNNPEEVGQHFARYYRTSRPDNQFSIFPVVVETTNDVTNFALEDNFTTIATRESSRNTPTAKTENRIPETTGDVANFASKENVTSVTRRKSLRNAMNTPTVETENHTPQDATTPHFLGELNKKCHFCEALYYKDECMGSLCCKQGSIQLELQQNYPELLQALLTNNHPKSKQFLKQIRTYNSRLAFASVSMNYEHPQGRGQPVIVISGVVYHNLGAVDERDMRFGTLYFCDPDDAQRARSSESNNDIDLDLIRQIDQILRNINPFANTYKQMRTILEEHRTQNPEADPNLAIKFHTEFPNLDRRRYNRPVNDNEIGAAFVSSDGEMPPPGELIIYRRSEEGQPEPPKKIPRISAIADPTCYPMIHPYGELGWDPHIRNERGSNGRVTMRQFYCYHLMKRPSNFNPKLAVGKLTQQYVIDAYSKVEGDRLHYLRTHQKQIRAEAYAGLQDYVTRRAQELGGTDAVGRLIVLPSSFTSGQRYMTNNYQDAMAIVCKYGKPSLFLTMTCNPNWPEIVAELGRVDDHTTILNPQDRPDIVCRVFKQKFEELKKTVIDGKLFGEVAAWVSVIEFQKRGLPHAHMLITLTSEDKIRDPQQVNQFICAEIPDKTLEPTLYEIITKMNIHGPCGDRNPDSPCMKDGVCTKHYPQKFSETTMLAEGRLPVYRRRDDGRTAEITLNRKVYTVDNRDVVPYNPMLSKRFGSHINVLLVSTVENVKYLFKYITKGPDAALITIENAQTDAPDEYVFDEIKDFQDTRYLTSCEGVWRLFAFKIVEKSHTVVRLIVHLPGEKLVYFEEGEEEVALENAEGRLSMLEAYFKLNATDPEARKYVYPEIPYHYRFERGEWKKRQRQRKIVSRMYTISPRWVEKFHLRILLLHVPGATSYEDLKTVDGYMCETFREAAERRHLIANDEEWVITLDEAAETMMPGQIRKLFSYLLCLCTINNPTELWNQYQNHMIDDYKKKGLDTTEATRRALIRIENMVLLLGRNLTEFGIESPLRLPIDIEDEFLDNEEFEQIANAIIDNIETPVILNELQQQAFNTIIHAVNHPEMFERYFYLQGSAGTGKTFLYNHLITTLNAAGMNTMSVAFTGIAALLLKNGRTAHSAFRLPLNITQTSNSTMKLQSIEAEHLRRLDLIIWDEISMTSSLMLDCVDRLLQTVRKNPKPFGGVAMLFGGDIRQLLPVAPFPVQQQELCFVNCESWRHVKVLQLTENQRVDPEEVEFANWLLKLGDGSLQPNINTSHNRGNIPLDSIIVPEQCLTNDVIQAVYSDLNYEDPQSHEEEFAKRTILCPTNSDCRTINEKLLSEMPGETITFLSADSVVTDDIQERLNFTEEYLNTLSVSGMPDHKLSLKKGTPVMLLRNFSINDGLINGTRLIIRSYTPHLLTAVIATGRYKNKEVHIPKMDMTSPENVFPFTFQRRQFPVKVCFAMTINKSQGQTFERVGIYLPSPVFSHGQLYVAFSRARRWEGVKVEVHNKQKQGRLIKKENHIFTRNVVNRELIRKVFHT